MDELAKLKQSLKSDVEAFKTCSIFIENVENTLLPLTKLKFVFTKMKETILP